MIETPRYLGPIPHPAIGVRIPKIFLEGILTAFKERNTAGGLMLSYGRETAPQYVIDSKPGTYDITLGHTGTSIKEYIMESVSAARNKNVIVEIEADHLIIGSSLQAVQRLYEARGSSSLDNEIIESSMEYNRRAIDEAIETGYVNTFTVDATSLIDYKIMQYPKEKLYELFEERIVDGKELLKRYANKKFVFSWIDGKLYNINFTEVEVMKAALAFDKNLKVTRQLYSYIEKKMNGKPFGFEIALDEIPVYTGKELALYLDMWKSMEAHIDFIAPYIGFRKREDYTGSLEELENRLSFLAAIANGYGCMLSIHSGSGLTPYTGKGKGVYDTIVRATWGRVKYKISGIYVELLLELLANSKEITHRKVFEKIFDDVKTYIEEQIKQNTPFASEGLKEKYGIYLENLKKGLCKEKDSRTDFFRHYSFIALNLRDSSGERYLKERLENLYQNDKDFKTLVDQEVKALTLRLIDGLNYSNNFIPKT
ncbi:MAG: tagaturonate epimerase family protein [Nitrososphaeria archaeon]